MDTEFHYYGIYHLAVQAGFSAADATLLAYSSQYVDHSLVPLRIEYEGEVYTTEVTQQYRFWDKSQERDVWIPLHFFPGDPKAASARRLDERLNPLVVTPHSPRVKEFLVAALRSRNLYRVGIALHTYADTWAHQDFTGRWEEYNVVNPQSAIPAIGHSQLMGKPDAFDATWEDPRLKPEYRTVENRERVLAAARMIYRYLCTYNRRSFEDEELVIEGLSEMFGLPGEKSDEERRLDLVIGTGAEQYDRLAWRKEAADIPSTVLADVSDSVAERIGWVREEIRQTAKLISPKLVPGKAGFRSSNLYRWNEAVKEQRGLARRMLSDLLKPEVRR
jgi:hypothetical protein